MRLLKQSSATVSVFLHRICCWYQPLRRRCSENTQPKRKSLRLIVCVTFDLQEPSVHGGGGPAAPPGDLLPADWLNPTSVLTDETKIGLESFVLRGQKVNVGPRLLALPAAAVPGGNRRLRQSV